MCSVAANYEEEPEGLELESARASAFGRGLKGEWTVTAVIFENFGSSFFSVGEDSNSPMQPRCRHERITEMLSRSARALPLGKRRALFFGGLKISRDQKRHFGAKERC